MSSKLKAILFGGDTGMGVMTDIGLTIFRVFSGLAMAFAHGLGKVPPSGGFVNKVGEMGFPSPSLFAWGAGLSELVGGILLAIGLCTRISALFLAVTLGIAAFVAHSNDLFGDGSFVGAEKALLFFTGYIIFLFAGSGRFGVDKFIR
ncbi:MAG: DoxX family protein [Opitutales bacterium]